jgi:hypothetical protein
MQFRTSDFDAGALAGRSPDAVEAAAERLGQLDFPALEDEDAVHDSEDPGLSLQM